MAMAGLKVKEVAHVAKLANLPLSKKEIEKFRKQLSSVISYVDELKKVDTKDVEPTSQTTGLENVTQKDEIDTSECLSQDKALSGTEKTHNGYFVVPGILEERSDR